MDHIYLKLKNLSDSIAEEIQQVIKNIPEEITIASVILGNDPASISYLKGMKKKALKLGMNLDIISIDDKNNNEKQFLEEFKKINTDNKYSGIIVQVPLPRWVNLFNLAQNIDYKKDIDCINPYNQGLLFCGKPFLIPATALASLLALEFISKEYSIPLEGKNAVIIGRSLTVGKPLFHLLLNKNITPTILHTKTINAPEITANKDIIIAACGVPELVTGEWVKKGAIIIDVGIHSIEDEKSEKGYRLCGDVDSKTTLESANIVTAVPGGIGTVTSTLIFANAVKCWYKIHEDKNFHFSFF